jgi:DNA-binding transcriptional MerR regulator
MKNSLPIAAVERDTGIPKDTLRVWERRYGFPHPLRDGNDERVYPPEQVHKLRLLRRLLDQGHRPGAIVARAAEELMSLLDETSQPQTRAPHDQFGELLELVRLSRSAELHAALRQYLLKLGLQGFVCNVVAPFNVLIGEAWLHGDIEVADEHMYTEQVQNLLRGAIGSQSPSGGLPRVLLTTFPDEQHVLGLLMVEAMLVSEGVQCVSLGAQTPVTDIAKSAISGSFDVVAVSFSAAFPARRALQGLAQLRPLLPASVALWAGGDGLRGKRAGVEGLQILVDLPGVVAALASWRAAQGSADGQG